MADTKTHKVTLIPGDGIGPEVTQAVVRIFEATGVNFEWERFAAGAEAFEILRRVHSRRAVSIHRAQPRRAERAGDHAHWRRLQEHQRDPAQKFDLFANFRPDQESSRPGDALAGRGPDHRARKHRGRVRGPGARGGSRRGGEHQGDYRKRLDAHCQVRLRVRAQAWPQEDSLHSQGQHHEALRRPVPALRAQSGRGFPDVSMAST